MPFSLKDDIVLGWSRYAFIDPPICQQVTADPGFTGSQATLWCCLEGKRIQLTALEAQNSTESLEPGQACLVSNSKVLKVGCCEGSLAVSELKPEGKKAQRAVDFWNGVRQGRNRLQFD